MKNGPCNVFIENKFHHEITAIRSHGNQRAVRGSNPPPLDLESSIPPLTNFRRE
jgi:hypothetical protein